MVVLCTFTLKSLELRKRCDLICMSESLECTGLGEDWRWVGHLAGFQVRADKTLNSSTHTARGDLKNGDELENQDSECCLESTSEIL